DRCPPAARRHLGRDALDAGGHRELLPPGGRGAGGVPGPRHVRDHAVPQRDRAGRGGADPHCHGTAGGGAAPALPCPCGAERHPLRGPEPVVLRADRAPPGAGLCAGVHVAPVGHPPRAAVPGREPHGAGAGRGADRLWGRADRRAARDREPAPGADRRRIVRRLLCGDFAHYQAAHADAAGHRDPVLAQRVPAAVLGGHYWLGRERASAEPGDAAVAPAHRSGGPVGTLVPDLGAGRRARLGRHAARLRAAAGDRGRGLGGLWGDFGHLRFRRRGPDPGRESHDAASRATAPGACPAL
ncbi:MAG: Membrane protein, partial [uncultured Rubellimicrobium sp.]